MTPDLVQSSWVVAIIRAEQWNVLSKSHYINSTCFAISDFRKPSAMSNNVYVEILVRNAHVRNGSISHKVFVYAAGHEYV